MGHSRMQRRLRRWLPARSTLPRQTQSLGAVRRSVVAGNPPASSREEKQGRRRFSTKPCPRSSPTTCFAGAIRVGLQIVGARCLDRWLANLGEHIQEEWWVTADQTAVRLLPRTVESGELHCRRRREDSAHVLPRPSATQHALLVSTEGGSNTEPEPLRLHPNSRVRPDPCGFYSRWPHTGTIQPLV